MKKLFSLLIVLVLAFGLIGCSGTGLKDGDVGYGNLKVNSPVDGSGEILEDTVVKLNGNDKDSTGFSEKLETGDYTVNVTKFGYEAYEKSFKLKKGENITLNPELPVLATEDVTLTLTDSEGTLVPSGADVDVTVNGQTSTYTTDASSQITVPNLPTTDVEVALKAGDYGKLTTTVTVEEGVNNSFDLELGAATNVHKFTFDPSAYDVTVNNEVHLVGDLPNAEWKPGNLSYSLSPQADGTWVGYFPVEEGKEFKFMYDATDWVGNSIGDGNGNNAVVEENPPVVTQEF